jgi:hypothetical protein
MAVDLSRFPARRVTEPAFEWVTLQSKLFFLNPCVTCPSQRSRKPFPLPHRQKDGNGGFFDWRLFEEGYTVSDFSLHVSSRNSRAFTRAATNH